MHERSTTMARMFNDKSLQEGRIKNTDHVMDDQLPLTGWWKKKRKKTKKRENQYQTRGGTLD